ncbi:MAG: PH domain-containing protein [Candidatus Nanohaloarchaea archaeon]
MFGKLEERDWFDLYENERVEWWSHPALLLYLPKLVPSSALLILGLAGIVTGYPGFDYSRVLYLLASLGVTGYILYILLEWRSVYYVVTDQRVIRKDGIIGEEIDTVNFSRVTNVKTDISIIERFLSLLVPDEDIGDLFIHTADDHRGDIKFVNVDGMSKAKEMIQSNLSQYSRNANQR